jgi:hypothetical protein
MGIMNKNLTKRKNNRILKKEDFLDDFCFTLPANVAAVKQGCIPSYLPIETVLVDILLFSFSEKMGTTIA